MVIKQPRLKPESKALAMKEAQRALEVTATAEVVAELFNKKLAKTQFREHSVSFAPVSKFFFIIRTIAGTLQIYTHAAKKARAGQRKQQEKVDTNADVHTYCPHRSAWQWLV